jgi:DNA-binding NtrC family response regulator
MQSGNTDQVKAENEGLIQKIYGEHPQTEIYQESNEAEILHLPQPPATETTPAYIEREQPKDRFHYAEEIEEEETLSLQEKEVELIKKSLERNRGKRKAAAEELGISERTLYRKIKQYDL